MPRIPKTGSRMLENSLHVAVHAPWQAGRDEQWRDMIQITLKIILKRGRNQILIGSLKNLIINIGLEMRFMFERVAVKIKFLWITKSLHGVSESITE